MRSYETIVVFNPMLGESQVKDEIKKIEGILSANKAKDVVVDNWGKKESAQNVNRKRFGFYAQFKYSSEDYNVVKEVNSLLRINEKVIKFQAHLTNTKKRKFKGNPNKSANSGEYNDGLFIDTDY